MILRLILAHAHYNIHTDSIIDIHTDGHIDTQFDRKVDWPATIFYQNINLLIIIVSNELSNISKLITNTVTATNMR